MIILLGKPGTGKSTQSKLLAKAKSYQWISTGDIIRKSLSDERLEQHNSGRLLTDAEMIEMLRPVLEKDIKNSEFILDGFPRTIPQAEWLIEETKRGRLKLSALFNLEISDEAAKSRLLSRGRVDDSPSVLEKRFEIYNQLTAPMIELFEQKGLTVHRINANQSQNKVQADIINALG